jgi:hypothetical protein
LAICLGGGGLVLQYPIFLALVSKGTFGS